MTSLRRLTLDMPLLRRLQLSLAQVSPTVDTLVVHWCADDFLDSPGVLMQRMELPRGLRHLHLSGSHMEASHPEELYDSRELPPETPCRPPACRAPCRAPCAPSPTPRLQ